MDVAQMMAHCAAALDMASGKLKLQRVLIGRVLGPFFKPIYTNEKPFAQNYPTDKKLLVADERDFSREKERLKGCIQAFHDGGEAECTRVRIPFLENFRLAIGAGECTNTSTITCGNLGRETVFAYSGSSDQLKVGNFTRSFLGTDSRGSPALRQAAKPPTITKY